MKNITINATGRLSECLLLAYRTPSQNVRHLLPRGLELDTVGDYAFWNVVACTVQDMRPSVLPAACGVDYHHVAYRLYVKGHVAAESNGAGSAGSQTVRGLYFVRSDADSALVGRLGNVFSDFRFHPADVELGAAGGVLTLAVRGLREEPDARDGEPHGDAGDAVVRVAADGVPVEFVPPAGSPFASAAEAAQFLKYPPLGLSADLDGRYLKLAEVIRDEAAWKETPVRVIESHLRFFEHMGLGEEEVVLERATRVTPIDYRWRLGRRLPLAAAPTKPVKAANVPTRPARAAA